MAPLPTIGIGGNLRSRARDTPLEFWAGQARSRRRSAIPAPISPPAQNSVAIGLRPVSGSVEPEALDAGVVAVLPVFEDPFDPEDPALPLLLCLLAFALLPLVDLVVDVPAASTTIVPCMNG
jgi:hypothetical protein